MASKFFKQRTIGVKGEESTGWDAAIRDAKRHIERLRAVVAVCEEKKESGEPWPGSLPNIKVTTQN